MDQRIALSQVVSQPHKMVGKYDWAAFWKQIKNCFKIAEGIYEDDDVMMLLVIDDDDDGDPLDEKDDEEDEDDGGANL